MAAVTLVVGTTKGGFVLRSDASREKWQVGPPFFKGWKVTAVARGGGGQWLAGTASDIYGAAIQRSDDLENWTQVEKGPGYPEGGSAKFTQVWRILTTDSDYFAGVHDAGLFRSRDQGASWEPVPGLNDHATRASWFPGAGGLCAHSILLDPRDARRMWVGISAVGVFRSEDGGDTWTPRNEGVPVTIEDEKLKDIGY